MIPCYCTDAFLWSDAISQMTAQESKRAKVTNTSAHQAGVPRLKGEDYKESRKQRSHPGEPSSWEDMAWTNELLKTGSKPDSAIFQPRSCSRISSSYMPEKGNVSECHQGSIQIFFHIKNKSHALNKITILLENSQLEYKHRKSNNFLTLPFSIFRHF